MTFNLTLSVASANARTGVIALEVAARHICWAVGVDDTFWFTFNIGISLVLRRTGADTVVPDLGGDSAAAARIWIAGVRDNRFG